MVEEERDKEYMLMFENHCRAEHLSYGKIQSVALIFPQADLDTATDIWGVQVERVEM